MDSGLDRASRTAIVSPGLKPLGITAGHYISIHVTIESVRQGSKHDNLHLSPASPARAVLERRAERRFAGRLLDHRRGADIGADVELGQVGAQRIERGLVLFDEQAGGGTTRERLETERAAARLQQGVT